MEEEWITGKISLELAGRAVEMEMTVPVNAVKPQRMLPIFQQMTSAFVNMSVTNANAEISCKAGCGACCRQPVPLSEIEIYQLSALVQSLEEPRRAVIKKRFADGSEHFRRTGWFDRMKEFTKKEGTESEESVQKRFAATVLEYFYENVPCPFLEEESCSIHAVRPLVCREYLVTSPAENCSRPTAETVCKVELLAKSSKSLRNLVQTEMSVQTGFVPMIFALELAEKYPENFPEKTGQRWVADFFENLSKTEIPTEGIPPRVQSPKSKVQNPGKKRC